MPPPIWEWSDLPDPRDPQAPQGSRCTVVASRQALEHIRQKHICNRREPWKDWLGANLVQRLRHLDAAGSNAPKASAAREELAKYLGAAIGECLRRPLVLLYEWTDEQRHRGGSALVWLLVLSSGTLLVIRGRGRKPHVTTCFYPRAARLAAKPEQRWRKVVAAQVARFADLRSRRVYPPQAGDIKTIARGQRASRIRFVTLASWGFDPRLPGAPWRGHLDPWPGTAARPASKRRRLAPRRMVEEYCDDAAFTGTR